MTPEDLDHLLADIMCDEMAYIRDAVFNAYHSGLDLKDVCEMARNAETPADFSEAVNMLTYAMPDGDFRVV